MKGWTKSKLASSFGILATLIAILMWVSGDSVSKVTTILLLICAGVLVGFLIGRMSQS
jgi:uncharacterized membrane protein SpoIIM required for sporulation